LPNPGTEPHWLPPSWGLMLHAQVSSLKESLPSPNAASPSKTPLQPSQVNTPHSVFREHIKNIPTSSQGAWRAEGLPSPVLSVCWACLGCGALSAWPRKAQRDGLWVVPSLCSGASCSSGVIYC
uniref:Uncharacterized protein n=1 Tax=Gopherus agassizii TaxID=38772 RepID=A0A452HDB3_9SAUR